MKTSKEMVEFEDISPKFLDEMFLGFAGENELSSIFDETLPSPLPNEESFDQELFNNDQTSPYAGEYLSSENSYGSDTSPAEAMGNERGFRYEPGPMQQYSLPTQPDSFGAGYYGTSVIPFSMSNHQAFPTLTSALSHLHFTPTLHQYYQTQFSPGQLQQLTSQVSHAAAVPTIAVPQQQTLVSQTTMQPGLQMAAKLTTVNEKVSIPRLSPTKPKHYPRESKRATHNQIEKKYRLSINERIEELRRILGGKGKSETLQNALEFIQDAQENLFPKAQRDIQLLKEENTRLRAKLAEMGEIVDIKTELPNDDAMLPSGFSPGQPESATSGSAPASPVVSLASPAARVVETVVEKKRAVAPPKRLEKKPFKQGTNDRARLLCVALMTVVCFNPAKYIVNKSMLAPSLDQPFSPSGTSSTDMGFTRESGGLPAWLIWTLNAVIVLGILIRLFVFGEPVLRPKTEAALRFWNLSRQADVDLAKGDRESAVRNMALAFEACGRPLPLGFFDNFASLCWQSLRHFLHHIVIGNWLEETVGFSLKNAQADRLEIVQKSARDAAILYHKLHRIYVTGLPKWERYLGGMNLALSAVNLAEAAGDALPADMFVEMYAAIALEMKRSLPKPLWYFLAYTLNRARRLCFKTYGDIPSQWRWLFHPLTLRFLRDYEIKFVDFPSQLTKLQAADDPVAYFARAFREHVLSGLMDSCDKVIQRKRPHESDDVVDGFLEKLDLVIECAAYRNEDWSLLENRGLLRDSRAQWWAALLGTCATSGPSQHYRIQSMKYMDIIAVPLASSPSHPAPQAVYACYKAAFCSSEKGDANWHTMTSASKQVSLALAQAVKHNDRFAVTALSIGSRWVLESVVHEGPGSVGRMQSLNPVNCGKIFTYERTLADLLRMEKMMVSRGAKMGLSAVPVLHSVPTRSGQL